MTSDQVSVAAVVGVVSAVLGWLGRGVSMASQWGALRAEVSGQRADIAEIKASFNAHLEQDKDRDVRFEAKMDALAQELHQLIGFVRASKEGPGL